MSKIIICKTKNCINNNNGCSLSNIVIDKGRCLMFKSKDSIEAPTINQNTTQRISGIVESKPAPRGGCKNCGRNRI